MLSMPSALSCSTVPARSLRCISGTAARKWVGMEGGDMQASNHSELQNRSATPANPSSAPKEGKYAPVVAGSFSS